MEYTYYLRNSDSQHRVGSIFTILTVLVAAINGAVVQFADNYLIMKRFNNFSSVLQDWESIPVPGRLYIQGDKKDGWQESVFWAVSSKEAKDALFVDGPYGSVPDFLKEERAKSFLETATFQDIIDNKLENNPQLSISEEAVFYNAVLYYLEQDDFED
ncbi:DUF7716 domain-containing protein [Fibrella aquatilis]|uniref:DUF7716 domain-containing protein n=1 Tax=Fibrella aquatilis TaxID=2817059 RepID=A0A939GBF4_9BACT|nr:hypothetical protein [Fibrella aquatilis]MBO0933303.1 hypothetical protein [Fibrella aquatilis]